MTPVAIVGAGISGLTAGFYLQQRGIPVVIFEASDRAGGMIQTASHGGYMAEYGPNTIMTNSVAVPTLIRDLGLESRRLIPSAAAEKRYIVRDGRPVPLPQSLPGAIGTKLLSLSAKLRVLAEPFIAKATLQDESLASFVVRRLGREFLDYLIDPFVAGVFAGDPEQLSVRHAFARMAALEDNYGSLVKGMFLGAKERRLRNAPLKSEPKMFSFDAGLRVLPDTLAERLNGAIRVRCPVDRVERDADCWRVYSPAGPQSFATVLFCSPAHQLLRIEPNFRQVYYPPIARIAFGFRKSQVAHPLDGFGVLVPRIESMSILGVLFSSSMFENRAPKEHVLLTVFAGGARNPHLLHETPDQIAKVALDDLRRLLGIIGTPSFVDSAIVKRSIPQYNVGYGAVKGLIQALETRCPGLFCAGSFSHGISVSDCIAGGLAAAEKVAAYSLDRSLTYA
jgi:oxygen-dependent protoporphyrinogen oxidase